MRLRFEDNSIRLDEQVIGKATEYKATWRKVKNSLQKATEFKRIEIYKTKEQQSQVYREQEEECHSWLNQSLHGQKTSSIMTMLEQMVKTKSRKVSRGLAQDKQCRVCRETDEIVEHIVAGCKVLANSEYLAQHNRALMIMAVNMVQRAMGTRSSVGERARETCFGFRIQFMKNHNGKEARPDIRIQRKEEDLDL